jgi:hypothetical protein
LIGKKALEVYDKISKRLNVETHSKESAQKRINELLKGKEEFIYLSRTLAKKAQRRERFTIQPKENLSGTKSIITLKNYLGGIYFLTVDEVKIEGKNIFLIESKHCKTNSLPSLENIKDGLLNMILFTNLEDVKANDKNYKPKAVLKLTVQNNFNEEKLNRSQKERLKILRREAYINNFKLKVS